MFDELAYRAFYKRMTDNEPYSYQVQVARLLVEGRNVILRAPTGAGKTYAVVLPFLYSEHQSRPSRLIYVLPLRTLAQGIYANVRQLFQRHGLSPDGVTIQTGEQPDDPFFERGRVIVTTFDQLLSGLLAAPYGLSSRLHNVNAAAVAGTMVVFDEFHLMEPQRAFLTAVAALHLFRHLCQSVWMTATATSALESVIDEALNVERIPDSESAAQQMYEELPSVARVTRRLVAEGMPLSAEAVLARHERRSLVVANTVARAQQLFEDLRKQGGTGETTILLLHSRFFREHRRGKEQRLRSLLGKGATGNAILVATQVVEVGLDISCEALHTEVCPMNAFVQRAGRCARFVDERGSVYVYPLPDAANAHRPYDKTDITATWEVLREHTGAKLTPSTLASWVQAVHEEDDDRALRSGWRGRLEECRRRIERNAIERNPVRVADLIREADSIAVILANTPPEHPDRLEPLTPARSTLKGFLHRVGWTPNIGWAWRGDEGSPWRAIASASDVDRSYLICLRPSVAAYDEELGLRLEQEGRAESPSRDVPPRPGYRSLAGETWIEHARNVADHALRRLAADGLEAGLLGRGLRLRYGLDSIAVTRVVEAAAILHDIGKLQTGWQTWAEEVQRARNPGYEHSEPLAHTDFDPSNPADLAMEGGLTHSRPAHAAASAFYAAPFIARMLEPVGREKIAPVFSACVAAILGHHGGWLGRDCTLGAGIQRLSPNSLSAMRRLLGWDNAKAVRELEVLADKRGWLEAVLAYSTGPDALLEWWPLVAYLTRCLRLADQRATEEGGFNA